MISVSLHVNALQERIDTVMRIIDETHPSSGLQPAHVGPISREARGLAVVLLFAAYEDLLTSLTRTVLEAAIKLRVSNRRLQPGLRAFALAGSAKSARNISEKKLYSITLPKLIEVAHRGGRSCTIDSNSFPHDGSFMKRSQIEVWCRLFLVPHPDRILYRTWTAIDSVVSERNGIAHGRKTPENVGRGYTESEIRRLINDWHADWLDFLREVERLAQSRDFFRTPR